MAEDQHRPAGGDPSTTPPGDGAARTRGALGRLARLAGEAAQQAQQAARERRPEAERLARRAAEQAQRAAQAAQHAAEARRPDAERLARRAAEQARAAAEAARPHVERAGREAGRYVREHDVEITRAALTGAELAMHRVLPPGVGQVIDVARAARARDGAPSAMRGETPGAPRDEDGRGDAERPPAS